MVETGGGLCRLTGSLTERICVRPSVSDSVAPGDVTDVVSVQRFLLQTPIPERWTQTCLPRRAPVALVKAVNVMNAYVNAHF